MTIRNPFRQRTLKATFDAVVHCYQTKHRDIWKEPGEPRPGNAWANYFWRGYDGVSIPRWDSHSRSWPANPSSSRASHPSSMISSVGRPSSRSPMR